jgi:predicted MPP superfamily phosphohydrolase
MKAFVLIAIIGLALAAFAPKKHTSLHETSSNKLVSELSKSTYGTTLLHLVQLHSMAQGPVQELLDAIEELLSDLNNAL